MIHHFFCLEWCLEIKLKPSCKSQSEKEYYENCECVFFFYFLRQAGFHLRLLCQAFDLFAGFLVSRIFRYSRATVCFHGNMAWGHVHHCRKGDPEYPNTPCPIVLKFLCMAHTFHFILVYRREGYLLLRNTSQTHGSDKRVRVIPNMTVVCHKSVPAR